MLILFRKIFAVGVVVVLSGCSGKGELPNFTTEGVISPAASCAIDPRTFSDAESLGTHGTGACSVRDAWRIRAMAGVTFSQPAIVNCAVANGFRQWLAEVVQPASAVHFGARVSKVTIAASYACRPRNGRSGAKLSEHGFGNAIDVSGFTLADGRELVVENYQPAAFFKSVRSAACGLFKTVLGPGSDASHRDHFHFDLAYRRSGKNYCD